VFLSLFLYTTGLFKECQSHKYKKQRAELDILPVATMNELNLMSLEDRLTQQERQLVERNHRPSL
jgi:hypothetical protein